MHELGDLPAAALRLTLLPRLYQYNGPSGEFLPSPAQAASLTVPYYFPASPRNRAMFAALPLTRATFNTIRAPSRKSNIRRTFRPMRTCGSTDTRTSQRMRRRRRVVLATVHGLRLGDYELNAHTRGLSGIFAKQFGSKHLVNVQASYTTATSMDMNNAQMFGAADTSRSW